MKYTGEGLKKIFYICKSQSTEKNKFITEFLSDTQGLCLATSIKVNRSQVAKSFLLC